jgi:hypothetical protein
LFFSGRTPETFIKPAGAYPPLQVIKYFYYKLQYANEPMPPAFPIAPEMAVELFMAANYLDA